MKQNVAVVYPSLQTHEGGPAVRITPIQELRRLSAACLLWEDGFYESGVAVASRIAELVPKVKAADVAALALECRTKQKLRHLPLHLVREMLRHPTHRPLAGSTLTSVIQRADELAEFLAIYWKEGKVPLSAQAKKGLAKAFLKFDEYALAKYNRDGAVKLRDVLFLCHAKPDTPEREALWKKLVANELQTPDTWEVALSGGANKKETFERLIAEQNLGALAFLRNLRNMQEAGVDPALVRTYSTLVGIERVLPFRFIAAARMVPQWEPIIEPMMMRALASAEKLPGRTVLLVDVSGSMDAKVSSKSDINRRDAACGLAILLREICEEVLVVAFESIVHPVPPRRGFALRDALCQWSGGTSIGSAVRYSAALGPERLIVITDEQSHDQVGPPPCKLAYMINVASNRNGVGYGPWTHIDGWSEACVDYIREFESLSER